MDILVLGDEAMAQYHPLSRVREGIEISLKGLGKAEFCTEYHKLVLQELKKYPVIISYIDAFRQLSGFDEILADYILEGGCILALHNGIITPEGSRLESIYGGNFVTHPHYCELEYITADYYWGKEERFVLAEEPYMIRRTGGHLQVFLWFMYENTRHEAGWLRKAGKVKVLYLAPGHDERTVRDVRFQKLLYHSITKII